MSRRGPLLVLGAATLWGTTGTAQALGPDGINAETVSLVRMIGGAMLLVAARMGGTTTPVRTLPRAGLIMAVATMAVSQPLFFGGVARTGVAIGTIVTIGSGPLLAGALAWVVRCEPIDRRWYVATAISIAGSIVLVSGGESAGVDKVGLLLALGAGLAWAVYLIGAKEIFEEADPVFAAGVVFAGAAILLAPTAFFSDASWMASGRGPGVVAWLAPTTALSYVLFSRGLERTRVAVTATLTLAEPLTAALLGLLILNEPARLTTISGIGMIVIGLVVLNRDA